MCFPCGRCKFRSWGNHTFWKLELLFYKPIWHCLIIRLEVLENPLPFIYFSLFWALFSSLSLYSPMGYFDGQCCMFLDSLGCVLLSTQENFMYWNWCLFFVIFGCLLLWQSINIVGVCVWSRISFSIWSLLFLFPKFEMMKHILLNLMAYLLWCILIIWNV